MLDLDQLPKEIRDRLELKEATDLTFGRALEENYTNELFETLEARKSVDVQHSYLASVFGSQGTGKSYIGVSLCAYLDPKFSVDNIYFDYNRLVYDRHKLKSHMAVLVDEQAETYGIDSNRVNIILGALKEQLRKKSIHFFFCSPILKSEYVTSMYIFETMFIDKSQKLCYAAYKTRELLTLGYVTVPHPLNFVDQKFLDAYEAKKDEHLEQLTGKPIDEIEEWYKKICADPLFKAAEKLYILKRGYMPIAVIMQVINSKYPEFKNSIIVGELAQRIKFKKEMMGDWTIPGVKKADQKKVDQTKNE